MVNLPIIKWVNIGLLLVCAVVSATPSLFAQQTDKKLANYNAIVIEKFEVERNAATEDFPKGLEEVIQGLVVSKMRDQKLFAEVIDGAPESGFTNASTSGKSVKGPGYTAQKASGPNGQEDATPGPGERRLILNGTVIIYDKGSRAARYFGGFGAGESKIKMRFVVKDAQTNAEVMSFEEQGTFKGLWTAFGGSQEEAYAKAANGVVKALIGELKKNR